MEVGDVPAVHRLLNEYLAKYRLAPIFESIDEIEHIFLGNGVVRSFVVLCSTSNDVTDLVSFYMLDTVSCADPRISLKTAHLFYVVPGTQKWSVLLSDALTLAAIAGVEMFNAFDTQDNSDTKVLEDLRFLKGDGILRYNLYNWRVGGSQELKSSDIGLIIA
jgi:glycylpeptide N-tetradecanoyltransferase